MKLRLKTYQIALVLLLSALLPLGFIASTMLRTTSAQTMQTAELREPKANVGICKGNHPTKKDFYKNVRMLPPLSVLEIVGNRVNYAFVENGIELGSVELEDGYSVVPKDFSHTNHSGCYGLTYCEIHKVVLLLDNVSQEQCKTVKQ